MSTTYWNPQDRLYHHVDDNEPKIMGKMDLYEVPEPVYVNGQTHPIWIRNTSSTASNTTFQYATETSYGTTTPVTNFRFNWNVSTGTGDCSYEVKKDTGAIAMAHGPVRTVTWRTDDTIAPGMVYAWDDRMVMDPKKAAKTQKEFEKAHKKSLELLKDWLSDAEYNYLMEDDNLEIPSKYEKDTIYIVSKDPMKRIGIKKHGKVVHKSLCIHASHSYADGDVLLANILLLKTDEKKFLEIANVHDYLA